MSKTDIETLRSVANFAHEGIQDVLATLLMELEDLKQDGIEQVRVESVIRVIQYRKEQELKIHKRKIAELDRYELLDRGSAAKATEG